MVQELNCRHCTTPDDFIHYTHSCPHVRTGAAALVSYEAPRGSAPYCGLESVVRVVVSVAESVALAVDEAGGGGIAIGCDVIGSDGGFSSVGVDSGELNSSCERKGGMKN